MSRRLLLINHAAEVGGGAEFGLLDIARYYGDRCHVLLFENGPLTRLLEAQGTSYTAMTLPAGVSGVRRQSGIFRALVSVPSVIEFAIRVARTARSYDVLYPNSQKAALIVLLLAPFVRRPVVWHLHDILSADHFATLQRRMMTWLANRSARRVIVVSRAARTSYVQSGGDPERTVVVYNGIDITRFDAVETADTAELRQRLGVAGVPIVGLFGRITPWKGQHVLLRALPALPGVHALIVGGALFGEADYLDKMRTLAHELGVADRVHWLGSRDDVPLLMRMVDVVVHASTAGEPFGRVIVEGMLAARPVLATDHGASRELLGEEQAALVPPGDPACLAKAIKAVLAMAPRERSVLGQRYRARAKAMFSLGAMLSGIAREVALDATG